MEENKEITQEIDWKDKYIHILADYQNLQKRSLEEKRAISKRACYDTLKCILPLYDDIVRGIYMSVQNGDGLHHVFSKFEKFLNDNHITPIDLKFFADNTNSQFDEKYAEAVGTLPLIEGKKENDIHVVSTGFMNADTKEIISYAKVMVYKEDSNG